MHSPDCSGDLGLQSDCIDDFGFLWVQDEAVVTGSASWVMAGNAADAIEGIEAGPALEARPAAPRVQALSFWKNPISPPPSPAFRDHLSGHDFSRADKLDEIRAGL
jgi:hypothetical protein